MIKSIKRRFGQIYSGSIFARFKSGTITDYDDLSEIPFSVDSGGCTSRNSGRAYSPPIMKSIDPILHG
ncbi:unnamed protein product [Linum trigynum]|uniref:Uncharacterized protein n=1 Tax=Linum trigynum TaxID=586398 RepID=A0AAV2EJH3_9ROSI